MRLGVAIQEPVPSRPFDRRTHGHRLLERLGGHGGSGEVWKAEAPGGFLVALRILPPEARRGPGCADLPEILRLARHPHVVVTTGAWLDEEATILAMELADGSLWDRFVEASARGRPGIPRGELIAYLADAAEGIDFLGRRGRAFDRAFPSGLPHRTITPRHLLIFGEGVKVSDPTPAWLADRTASRRPGPQTLAYCAPEVLDGRPTRGSDQYALAAIYCQMLTGRLPSAGDHAEIPGDRSPAIPDLDMLPEEERPVVARALAEAPSDRWADCRAFVEALGRIRPDRAAASAATLPILRDDRADHRGVVRSLEGPAPQAEGRASGPASSPQCVAEDGNTPPARPCALVHVEMGDPGAIEAAVALPPPPPSGRIRSGSPGAGLRRVFVAAAVIAALVLGGLRNRDPADRPPTPDESQAAAAPQTTWRVLRPAATDGLGIPTRTDPPAGDGVGPETPEGYNRRGLERHRAGTLSESLDDFDAALRLDPRYAPALSNRGALHLREGRYPEAFADLDDALRLDPDDVMAYANRALAYRAWGDHARALDDYDEALRRDPSNAFVSYQRAAARALAGDHLGAIADFTRAIRLDPRFARAYRARGDAHARLGDHARAEEDHARALRLERGEPGDSAEQLRPGARD